jgi:hypothetical protein
MALYSYQRVCSDRAGWLPLLEELCDVVATSLPGKKFSVASEGADIVFDFELSLTDAEKLILDDVFDQAKNSAELKICKNRKYQEIDTRTDELIDRGFNFGGLTFSLSQAAQSTLLGLDLTKGDPLLSYPIKYNTKDDSDTITLNNAVEVHGFFLTAVGTYRQWLDSGVALKDLVRSANTVADVIAILDER